MTPTFTSNTLQSSLVLRELKRRLELVVPDVTAPGVAHVEVLAVACGFSKSYGSNARTAALLCVEVA